MKHAWLVGCMQALAALLLPAAAALHVRESTPLLGVCSPSLPESKRQPSPDRQWLEDHLAKVRKTTRLVQTQSRIDLVEEPQEDEVKATYKYIGCYKVTMNETHLLKPESPPSAMTVSKCYGFCHEAELSGEKAFGGKPQFFLLKGGKECSCSHYIDKDPKASKEERCSESCEGKDTEMCGGAETQSVYVMIDCPILPKSKVQKIKDLQAKEALADAEEFVKKDQVAKGARPQPEKKESLSSSMKEGEEKDTAKERKPINSPYRIPPHPAAPTGECGMVRCFEPVCADRFKKGFVQGNCCFSCIPGTDGEKGAGPARATFQASRYVERKTASPAAAPPLAASAPAAVAAASPSAAR